VSWLSSLLGTNPTHPGGKYSGQYDATMKQYEDPNAGSAQLGEAIRSQISAAMPQFEKRLGGVRENAIARGISTGDLGTSYEGDLASSFQRHISDSVAGQQFNLFQNNRNSFLDLLTGGMDREDDAQNESRNRKAGLMGGLIGGVASLFGGD
jgi:hypothetical protein